MPLMQRYQTRLPAQYEARNLFNTPSAGPSNPPGTARAVEILGCGAVTQSRLLDPPHRDQTLPRCFSMPSGHYSNPMDNMIAVATRLNAIPITDETPFAAKVRNAIELLQTAVAHEKYSHSRQRVHSTPLPSRSYSRHVESPVVSSSERCC